MKKNLMKMKLIFLFIIVMFIALLIVSPAKACTDEPDCNYNGVSDSSEIANDPSLDCNENGVLDSCEIADDSSPDCNENGMLDSCEIANDPSLDCNENGVLDSCEIANDSSPDCDENGMLDSCEIANNPSLDCDGDGVLDSCQIADDPSLDCYPVGDPDGVLNSCEIENFIVRDCEEIYNDNGELTYGDGVPDLCQGSVSQDLLYALEGNHVNGITYLHVIDTDTGLVQASVEIKLEGITPGGMPLTPFGGTALVVEPDTGILWALVKLLDSSMQLVTINPANIDFDTGSAVAESKGNLGMYVSDLLFDSEGNLYALTGVIDRWDFPYDRESLYRVMYNDTTDSWEMMYDNPVISLDKEDFASKGIAISSKPNDDYFYHVTTDNSGTLVFGHFQLDGTYVHDFTDDVSLAGYHAPGALTYWEDNNSFLFSVRYPDRSSLRDKLYRIRYEALNNEYVVEEVIEPLKCEDSMNPNCWLRSLGLAFVSTSSQGGTSSQVEDIDNDCIPDGIDNCTFIPNPYQENSGNGSYGDACDCDRNDSLDSFEIAADTSLDCDKDGILDSCEIADDASLDCAGEEGVLDSCEFTTSELSRDCDRNGIPDVCDIAGDQRLDCDEDGILDSCEIADDASLDCDNNNIPDVCDIADGTHQDCNGNGIPDTCDIAEGISKDCNGDGIPDECRSHCSDCKGKVTELTLQYNGDTEAYIRVVQEQKKKKVKKKKYNKKEKEKKKKVKKGKTDYEVSVFDGTIKPGSEFTFCGMDKHGTLGNEIRIYINGKLNTKIHTNCVKPIGPCMKFGLFTVIEGYSKYGGLLCPVSHSDDKQCRKCKGKVTELTMIWNGDQPIKIKAWHTWDKKKHKGDGLLAEINTIRSGDEVTVSGYEGATNDVVWEIFEAGTEVKLGESIFHLSCSDPDMNSSDDCGKPQGNGKRNESCYSNDWLFKGMVDGALRRLDCP